MKDPLSKFEFGDFPKTSQPAMQALQVAGFTRLEQLTSITEKDLGKLHGMGPKALRILREALAAKNLKFKSE
jgi:DNA-directed RNA polymerase alpha subunit